MLRRRPLRPEHRGAASPATQDSASRAAGKERPIIAPRAFGHVFDVDGRLHYYDVNSQEIVAVEPALAQVLDPAWGPDFAPGSVEIEQARRTVLMAREAEGLFLAHRPALVPPPAGTPVDTDLEHLVLTVTERCNLRCRYCLHGADLDWVRAHGPHVMTAGTARRALAYFLDRCAARKAPVISLYGGEPLLELRLVQEIVAVARRHPRGRDAVCVLDTNGLLLDDAAVDFVAEQGLHLQVSLDGPREVHDRYRRTPDGEPTHDRIMANLDRLLARSRATARRLVFVVTLSEPVDLAAVADFFGRFPPYRRVGIEQPPVLRVIRANLRGLDWLDGNGSPNLSEQIDAAREDYVAAVASGRRDALSPVIRALFEPALLRLHRRSRAPLGPTWVPGGNCAPGRRKLHVSARGGFHPCEKTGDAMGIGSVETGLRAPAVRGLQARFHAAVQERCGTCWALRLCGVCFAAQAECADLDRGLFPVPEAVCAAVRADREATLRLLVRILALPAARRTFLDAAPRGDGGPSAAP